MKNPIRNTWALNTIFLGIIVIFSAGCNSNKFDYKSAYKFNAPSKTLKVENKTSALSSLEANAEQKISIEQKPVQMEKNFAVQSLDIKNNNSSTAEKTLTKRERKLIQRIEKKIERKLEVKPAASRAVNGKVYTGVIVGAAGLILMILTSGTLGAIGGLALLVGLIFIVWGLLE